MRVAHVCPVFSATSETFIHDTVVQTHARGAPGHVITFSRENAVTRPFGNVIVARQQQSVVDKLIRRFNGSWQAQSRARARGVAAAVRQLKPDLVHAHFGPTGVVTAMGISEDVPLCVSYHGYDLSILLRDEAWLRRYRRLFARAQAFTAVSRLHLHRLINLGCAPEKVHLIRVGKVVEHFSFEPRHRPIRNFVTVGRLIEKKGHADAVRALASLKRAGHEVCLEVLGGGRLESELRTIIRRENVEDVVVLRGEVSHEVVKERLREADAFLLCSRTGPDGDEEGVPTVLMEAQAIGLPCVSTRHAGIPEVIPESQHDLLAEEGDVEGIAACMLRLMSADAARRASIVESGRQKVAEEFNLETESTKLVGVYRDLLR